MIGFDDFASRKWTFIGRNTARTFATTMEHFKSRKREEEEKKENEKNEEEILGENDTREGQYLKDLNQWEELVEMARSGADLVHIFGRYLLILESENARMKLQIKYVARDNLWLRNEMYLLYNILRTLEKKFQKAEITKKVYKSLYDMRNPFKVSGKTHLGKGIDGEEEEGDSDPEEEVPKNLSAMFHIVGQFLAEKNFVVASSWCLKSLKDFGRKYGEGSLEVGAVYNLLGRISKKCGEYAMAKKYLEQSLGIREKMGGKESDLVGITMSLLGSTLGRLGRYKEGLEVCKRALEIREKIYGRNQEVAHIYRKMAEFSFHMKLWNGCISGYQVCLPVFDLTYDITDSSVLRALTNLAHAYLHKGLPEMSLECLRKINSAFMRRKNPSEWNGFETPLSLIEDLIRTKMDSFSPEMMFQRFGPSSNCLDEHVFQVMKLYFVRIFRPEISEMLKEWEELSDRNLGKEPFVFEIQPPRRSGATEPKELMKSDVPRTKRITVAIKN